ncbi:MAG: carboxypeptidase regulatory-like domain-containing protein [Ignavibacteriae bacterium]|nr:carboxypeptidase regulatory-like domain-containing protein [Ignavibacteriota bacterium]
MKYVRFLSILPLLLILFAGCKVSDSPTNLDGNQNGSMITTTIAGTVNDESGQPLAGAVVTISENGIVKNSVTTNKFGSFMIRNANVPASRCFILCKKNGYFTGSRAEIPNQGKITEMRLTMQSSATTHSVNSASGGKVNIGNANVTFPANAFVTSSGTTYNGTVNIAAKFLDPTSTSFYNSFSGDMTATRVDGSQTQLLSYGVLRVEIKDASGNELKIATGKTATLTYPLAASMQKDAPASMPLWYFDETLGMWKEEGIATKTGNFYSGEVTHFTSWNCDHPDQTGLVKGRVVCNGTEGVEGVYITVGERKVITDQDGYYSSLVPMNIAFDISINPKENNGLTAIPTHVLSLSPAEVRTIPDIQLESCPATITGTIVDCNSSPISGTVIISFNGSYHCYFTTSGNFKIRVPANVPMTIEATTYNGEIALPIAVPAINNDLNYSVGTISACENGTTADFYDVSYGNGQAQSILLSPDGSLLVVNGYRPKENFTEVYDVKTGVKLCSFIVDSSQYLANFSADGSRLLVHWGYDSMCVVNPMTGAVIQKVKASDGRLTPDGASIIIIDGYPRDPIKLSIYSVADGSKIKDLSFNEKGYLVLVGLRGTSEIQFMDGGRNNARIISWDYVSDTKVTDITIPNLSSYYSPHGTGSGFSPDGSIAGLQDFTQQSTMNFYNSETGSVINSSPFSISGNSKNSELGYVGVANDQTFVVQAISNNGQGSAQPSIFTIGDGKLKKVLPISSSAMNILYRNFNYSYNSQYLAGIPYINNVNESVASVRVWRVK